MRLVSRLLRFSKVIPQTPFQQRTFKTLWGCNYLRGSYGYMESDEGLTIRRRPRKIIPENDEDSDDLWPTIDNEDEPKFEPKKGVDKVKLDDSRSYTPSVKQPSKRLLKMIIDDAASFDSTAVEGHDNRWSTPGYPASAERLAKSRIQSRHAPPPRPNLDPEHATIILFPGQGAQYPGMARCLLGYPNVKRMFNAASEILEYDLLDMCLKGDRDELSQTIYSQPATVVASLAAIEKLKDETPHVLENCTATAGFSVGEITSFIFANVLNFEDGIKLLRIRAEAMQVASEMTPGGMMTVFYGAKGRIGFACKAAREFCIEEGIEDPECTIANYLYPGCKVLSGHKKALDFIARNASDFQITRFKRLRVGGAFHSRLMLPASEAVRQAMESIKISDPLITVYSNVDGRPYRDASHIRRIHPKQMYAPVKWEQALHALYERPVGSCYPHTYECGPGRMLSTVLQKVNVKAYSSSHIVEV